MVDMNAFDPMAVVVDWLDAYRAKDLIAILDLYDDDATVECDCDGLKILAGKEALAAYWKQRLEEMPASELSDLQATTDGVNVAYATAHGIVSAIVELGASGKIARVRCGS